MTRTSHLIAAAATFVYTLAGAPSVQAEEHEHHHAVVDSRQALVLSQGERAAVLMEMRQFLTGIQSITSALARDDVKSVAPIASKLGMQAAHDMSAALHTKMPLEFRQKGMAVHQAFDQVAMDAESMGDVKHTLGQMGTLLQTCVACHEQFRIERASVRARK